MAATFPLNESMSVNALISYQNLLDDWSSGWVAVISILFFQETVSWVSNN